MAGILEDSPRFDYSGGASCPSLLLEPSRTNIVPISEGIPEDTIQVTLTENYGTSPEGVQNSLKVQKNGVSASDRIFPIDNYNATLVSGTSYSVSAFVKNIDVDGITTIGCRLGSGGTLFRLGYQWSGSSLTKATEYSAGTRTNEILEDYGNRWWRIGFSFEADNTQGGIELDIDRDNGSATTSIETYGWQLEEGSYPTSYIPNHSGGSVTREADSMDSSSFQSSGIVSATSDYTIFFDISNDKANTASGGNSQWLKGRNSSDFNIWTLRKNDVTDQKKHSLYFNEDSSFVFSNQTINKACFIFTSSEIKVFLDGSLNTTYSVTNSPLGLDDFIISYGSSNRTNIVLSQFLIFPTALSDNQCITLTS